MKVYLIYAFPIWVPVMRVSCLTITVCIRRQPYTHQAKSGALVALVNPWVRPDVPHHDVVMGLTWLVRVKAGGVRKAVNLGLGWGGGGGGVKYYV